MRRPHDRMELLTLVVLADASHRKYAQLPKVCRHAALWGDLWTFTFAEALKRTLYQGRLGVVAQVYQHATTPQHCTSNL